jgi:predicted patatin/cPLA2 family phospholipase
MKASQSALIVEGGGLRGAFSAGVLAELEQHQALDFDCCYATSAAAPSAAYWLAGQIEDAVHIWQHFTSGSQLISPGRLLRGRSIMDLDRLVGVFEKWVPLNTERLTSSRTLFVTVTNCTNGCAEYIPIEPDNAFALLKASMALPVAYGPSVLVRGVPYIDGGLTDSIAIDTVIATSPSRTLVVLTQPHGYRKKPAPVAARLMARYYRQYPALESAFGNRYKIYNSSVTLVEALESKGTIDVIRPAHPLPASRLSRDQGLIRSTLEAGRKAARDWLERKRW